MTCFVTCFVISYVLFVAIFRAKNPCISFWRGGGEICTAKVISDILATLESLSIRAVFRRDLLLESSIRSKMIKVGLGPNIEDADALVLIKVRRSANDSRSVESTWTKPLGQDLYEIRGPVHLISDINTGDVVKAVLLPNDSIPSLVEVVARSGYKTVHVAFAATVTLLEQQRILEELEKWKVRYELVFDRLYTIEVAPDGDYEAFRAELNTLKVSGLLMYEPDVAMNVLLRCRFLS